MAIQVFSVDHLTALSWGRWPLPKQSWFSHGVFGSPQEGERGSQMPDWINWFFLFLGILQKLLDKNFQSIELKESPLFSIICWKKNSNNWKISRNMGTPVDIIFHFFHQPKICSYSFTTSFQIFLSLLIPTYLSLKIFHFY